MNTSLFYLFAFSTGAADESPATVFYKVKGESLAESLCRLFTREYADSGGRPAFHHKAATLIPTEDQVLFDESLDWLAVYDEPDPGVYDPSPSKGTLLRAQYAVRARKWEELLIERSESRDQNITPNKTDTSPKSPAITDEEIPEMAVEDRRNSGLILLFLLAQAYYKMLESTISMATWCTALDLELNQSYLWTVTSISNLLENHKDLKDFPIEFKPLFSDLYPSTIGDVDWEEMVAPDAERFLSAVQQYVHSKGIYDPKEGSPAWAFIQLFRPSVNAAIERAIAYNKRMHQYYQQLLGPSLRAAPGSKTNPGKVGPAASKASKDESFAVHTQEKRFKIALSFPGERRPYVEGVASHLASIVGRDRVLYDTYYEAEFCRPDLDIYLQRLYHDESELIVVFLCVDYETKQWCGLEWRAIRDLIKRRHTSTVMPFRFDNTEIAGLFSIDGYISIKDRPAKEVAELILERLALKKGMGKDV